MSPSGQPTPSSPPGGPVSIPVLQRADEILENITDAFIALDREWRIIFCNSAYLQLVAPLHPSPASLLGHNLWEKFPDIVDSEAGRFYRACVDTQKPGTLQLFYSPLSTWLELRAFPTTRGLTIYVSDITGRKSREDRVAQLTSKISEQAALFDAILSNIPDLAYAFNREIRFLYANKPLLAILGRPLEEVVGKTCHELGYPTDLANRLEEQLRQVFATGRAYQGETPLTDASGHTDHHEYIYSPAFGPDGSVSAVVGTTRLVTARKHAALVAERQARILQLTAQGAPLVRILEEIALSFEFEIHQKGVASILLADTPAARLRSGAAPSLPVEYSRAIDGLAIAPASGSCGTAAWSRQAVYTTDIAHDPCWQKFRSLALSHQLRACWSLPILSGDGELLGTFAVYFTEPREPAGDELRILENSTRAAAIAIERERSEDAIHASERQLRLVTDHASVLLAHMDRAYRYKFVNRPYATRYGLTPEQTVGQHAVEIVGQTLFDRARPYIDRALAGEETEFELDITLPGRDTRWSHVVYTPERSPTGEVIGFVAVHTDITLRKKAELDATRARDEAVRAGQAKDEFLAALSHELRTPLNPVLLLASEAARNPALPLPVREDFNTIAKNVQLEARLIDDLLDLTRITRGKMSLDLQTVDVHAVLRDAIDNVRADLEAQSLHLETALDAPRSLLTGDPARLQQVFWNVLKNAVKFTPPGGRIRIATSSTPDNGSLAIVISDTGIGMTTEELPRIFNSFEQGDHSHKAEKHRFGGLGLGLSISRRLVELHAGSIGASSAGRGQGSSFTIQLPFTGTPSSAPTSRTSRPPLPPAEGPASPASTPAHILLVEDHAPTRTALTQLLARRKYTVTAASSVAEALDEASRRSFAFVISDIGLPDGDGYKLMATLRERHGLRGIALSGYGMEQDVAQGRVAGFITHLIKPVDVRTLENALALIATRSAG